MDIAIRDFCKKIKDNDCALVYFSGHGMESNVSNIKRKLRQLLKFKETCTQFL